jgi:hypothetical protein
VVVAPANSSIQAAAVERRRLVKMEDEEYNPVLLSPHQTNKISFGGTQVIPFLVLLLC